MFWDPNFYIYAAAVLFTGSDWYVIESTTELDCRVACNERGYEWCSQYRYSTSYNESACHLSGTIANLTTIGISASNPGWIVGQKLTPDRLTL